MLVDVCLLSASLTYLLPPACQQGHGSRACSQLSPVPCCSTMLLPKALCCVQAWISPLQLGELHGSPTYAAGAEKGMLTRISSGSSLRHLATGPLSRSGSCSILLCSAALSKLTQIRQQL